MTRWTTAGKFWKKIVRRPWKAHFTTMGVSPKYLDNQLLHLMERAGFSSFMITPESASETMLSNYRKGFALEDLRRAAEAINRFSFPVLWYFLVAARARPRTPFRKPWISLSAIWSVRDDRLTTWPISF